MFARTHFPDGRMVTPRNSYDEGTLLSLLGVLAVLADEGGKETLLLMGIFAFLVEKGGEEPRLLYTVLAFLVAEAGGDRLGVGE
jgi:hypothetical protein